MNEFIIIKFLIQNQKKLPILDQYPYIYGYNFPLVPKYPELGKMELLLTDGKMNFLGIKVKFIDTSSNEKQKIKLRKEINKQATTFAQKFKAAYPEISINSHIITNESFELDYKEYYVDYMNFLEAEWEKIITMYKELK